MDAKITVPIWRDDPRARVVPKYDNVPAGTWVGAYRSDRPLFTVEVETSELSECEAWLAEQFNGCCVAGKTIRFGDLIAYNADGNSCHWLWPLINRGENGPEYLARVVAGLREAGAIVIERSGKYLEI